MITEIIRYQIPPASAEAFARAYAAAGTILSASPHCLGWELLRCTESPESWTVLIRWRSAAAHLEGFRRSPEFREFLPHVQPFFSHILEMKHYAAVPH